MNAVDTYRRMFATPTDGLAAYWYFGTMFVQVEDLPELPVITAETLMVYKTSTPEPDTLVMDWWEIGVMRDPVTGEIAEHWVNPITGATIPTPRKFEEGPAGFVVRPQGDGLKIELVQAHAKVIGVETTITESDGRVFLDQVERKYRGFPRPDGTFPEPGEPGSFEARTQLSIWADRAELESSAYPFSSGSYSFSLGLPPWMGFGDRAGACITRGIMRKAPMNDPLNGIAWARLKAEYPGRFDGDAVAPAWADAATA